MSAYVASALEEKVKLDELSALLDEMLADSGGPLTPAERRNADRELGLTLDAGALIAFERNDRRVAR